MEASGLAEYWVTFGVLDTEASALEDATGVEEDERVGGVVTQEPSDDTAMVVFQVRAADPDGAWAEALDAYARLRRNARLDDAPPLSGSVTHLRDLLTSTPTTGPAPPPAAPITVPSQAHERLLVKASELFAQDDYDYATVAAQAACEVAIARALRRLVAANAPLLQVALEGFMGNRFSLAQMQVSRLWDALTGDDIRHRGFWTSYEEHRARRNGIVHAGDTVTRDQAEASMAVAHEVCDHVTQRSP